ncbi:Chemotaxis protein [Methylorubrum aminovorans]
MIRVFVPGVKPMDKIAAEAARLLFADGGAGWIVAVLLGVACLHLYRDGLRVLEARIAETGATAAALERASQTNAAVAAALESRTRVLEDLVRLTGETAGAVARSDERARERFEDLLRRIGELQHRPSL